jgi:glycerophosphoryl diester phosphodiesterase
MEIIGHRGAKGLAKENTLASIKKAIEFKVDMIELDVRVHRSELVLSHEGTIKTQSYDSLVDALKLIGNKMPVNLEIKEQKAIKHLRAIVEKYSCDIIFSSFKFSHLQEIVDYLPNAKIAVLENWSGIRAVTHATRIGTKRIHINHQWLWSGFVHSMVNQGYDLYAYTVNTKQRAQELESWGVKGIFTDYPNRMVD